MLEQILIAEPVATSAGFALARFPTRWTHLVDKKSRHFDMLEQILIAEPVATSAGFALGAALLALAGCAPTPLSDGRPKPAYELPAPRPGEHPCVVYATDIFGRWYCRTRAHS
jgi:hypothetical protein